MFYSRSTEAKALNKGLPFTQTHPHTAAAAMKKALPPAIRSNLGFSVSPTALYLYFICEVNRVERGQFFSIIINNVTVLQIQKTTAVTEVTENSDKCPFVSVLEGY